MTPSDAGQSPQPARRRVILAGHVVYMLLNSFLFANVLWLMPLLVRLRFGADDPAVKDWQTTLVTAAIPAFLIFSIFWGELLRRAKLRTYLMVFWLLGALPLGGVALAQDYWEFFVCHVAGAVGFAGLAPLDGKLLKSFYADTVRGRMYAILHGTRLTGAILSVYFVGRWLEHDPEAFRVFFPAAAALQVLGFGLLLGLVRLARTDDQPAAGTARPWVALLRPVLHMGDVLRTNRMFLRYELAFMTYGAAFMFCDALLPVLATTKFDMRYEDYSQFTQMITRFAMLLTILPMGWLLDRIGPVRTSGIAFGILGLYPVLLLLAGTPGVSVWLVPCTGWGSRA